jgi:hypothetical protein
MREFALQALDALAQGLQLLPGRCESRRAGG